MNIIDESATFRIVATLKLLLDEPDVYTRKQLAAKIGVNFDTIKSILICCEKQVLRSNILTIPIIFTIFPIYQSNMKTI